MREGLLTKPPNISTNTLMTTKTYKVTCMKCNNSDKVVIDEQRNIYWKPTEHIISGRHRLDMQWGWQCVCGNNDIVTRQEEREIANLQSPDPMDIKNVLESIIPDRPKFRMVAI